MALNSLLNIQVRVISRQAQAQLASVQRQMATMQKQSATSAANASRFGTLGAAAMIKWGSQTQWAGRQLTYNFTIPLALAAGAATKFELDNERAMTRVRKVYGDTSMSAKQMRSETDALAKSFRVLSDTFGVNQAEVINVGADWAAAGASGLALAKATKLTMETMILGEMDAASATKSLIAIQSQYQMSTGQLSKTIDLLNMVENQTATSMSDLIVALSRAAGSANSAGVDVRYLAADVAALVPAAGTATQAGNALKTIFSRLLQPTTAAANALKLIGININSTNWQSKTAQDRLTVLAGKYKDLSGAQKVYISSVLVGRYQLNRFDILLRAIASHQSYYWKALNSSGDAAANYMQKQKELNQVLSSAPQQFQQLKVQLENMGAQIIQPLIPLLLALAQAIRQGVMWFTNLSPSIQKAVVFGLAFIAILGPIIRMAGALMVLGGFLVRVFEMPLIALKALAQAFVSFITFIARGAVTILMGAGRLIFMALTSPWGLAIAAAVALLVGFRDQIAQLWHNIVNFFQQGAQGAAAPFVSMVQFFQKMIADIVRAFDALPQGVKDALMAVVHLVESAAKQVYELFQYMNPFAQHSPSLVDNTKNGMAQVRGHHGKALQSAQQHTKAMASAHKTMTSSMSAANRSSGFDAGGGGSQVSASVNQASSDVGKLDSVIGRAIGDLNKFRAAAKGMIPNEWADEIKDIRKGMPSLLPMFMKMIGDLKTLNAQLHQQHQAVQAQQQVVNQYKQALNAANRELDKQQKLLDQENNKLDKLKNQYSHAQDQLSKFANAPIKGMQAFSDKIFKNEEAQKKLQLRMDQWTKKNGSVQDLSDKFAKLNGEISDLQGQAAALRAKGAGSDVLGPIDAQIARLQKQAGATQKAIANSPIDKMQKQMDKLQQSGEILQLQNDIKFDPLERQISKLSDTTKELSYKDIIQGIKDAKAKMKELGPEIKDQNDKIRDQKKVVDAATKSRDKAQREYDQEEKKLKHLQAAYDRTTHAIDRIKNVMNDVGSAASAEVQKLDAASKATKKLADTTGAAFNKMGKADFGNVGGKGKIGREGILGDQSKAIDAWTKRMQQQLANSLGKMDLFGPLKQKWEAFWAWVKKYIGPILGDLGHALLAGFQGIGKLIALAIKGVIAIFHSNFFQSIWQDILTAAKAVVDALKLIWPDIKRVAEAIINAVKQIWNELRPALTELFKALKPVIAVLGVAFVGALKIVASVISNVIGPALTTVIHGITDLVKIATDVINTIVDLFTHPGKVFSDLKKLIGDSLAAIWHGISGFFKTVWGAVKGFVTGVWNFFVWLWDHASQTWKDGVHNLWNIIIWLPKQVYNVISTMVTNIVKFFTMMGKYVYNAVKTGFEVTLTFFKNIGEKIIHFIGNAARMLYGVGKLIITGLWNGIKFVAEKVWNWLKGVAERVTHNIGKVARLLFDKGKDLLNGLWDGITKAAMKIWNFFKDLGKTIFNRIGRVARTLYQKGVDFLRGLFDGIKSVASNIWDWFQGLGKRFLGFFSNAGGWLLRAGRDVMGSWGDKTGFFGGVHLVWDNVSDFFKNIGENIQRFFRGAPHWLYKVGKDIMGGLVDGVKWIWEHALKPFFQGALNGLGSVVNGVISGINFLLHGVNAVIRFLHLGNGIPDIPRWSVPQLAGGGVMDKLFNKQVGGGFKTNKPRAIVGEGGTAPEYVIPTDSRHRGNALKLFRSLSKDLGIPGFAMGGKLPKGKKHKSVDLGEPFNPGWVSLELGHAGDDLTPNWNPLTALKDLLVEGLRKAAAAMFIPFKNLGDAALNALGDNFFTDIGHAELNNIYNWIKGDAAQQSPYGNMPNGFAIYMIIRDMSHHSGWGSKADSPVNSFLGRVASTSGGNFTYKSGSKGSKGQFGYGLMDITPSTWISHGGHVIGGRSIWDPYSNLWAGAHYMMEHGGAPAGPMRNGTMFHKGGWSLAGENGPELRYFGRGSSVFDNTKTVNMITRAIVKAENKAAARRVPSAANGTTIHNNYTENKEVHIHVANLSLPNISSEQDMEAFVSSLESLAEGSL